MTNEEMQEHATRLLNIALEDPEYCAVYEDEGLEDESEEVWEAIHAFMSGAKATFTWSN